MVQTTLRSHLPTGGMACFPLTNRVMPCCRIGPHCRFQPVAEYQGQGVIFVLHGSPLALVSCSVHLLGAMNGAA